ncbi:hypothetical protein HK405_014146 [Cladochytrium tenue]|nr:hypothetical protein HK405_014146 [Cladochytrium tenue]
MTAYMPSFFCRICGVPFAADLDPEASALAPEDQWHTTAAVAIFSDGGGPPTPFGSVAADAGRVDCCLSPGYRDPNGIEFDLHLDEPDRRPAACVLHAACGVFLAFALRRRSLTWSDACLWLHTQQAHVSPLVDIFRNPETVSRDLIVHSYH